MTDTSHPSAPHPRLSATSYCALVAADTTEAATLHRLIADTTGTTLAVDTLPQEAAELNSGRFSRQKPAAHAAPIVAVSRDWLLNTDSRPGGPAEGVTNVLLPASTITDSEDREREQLIKQAANSLPPGGQLIASTQHVVGDASLSETWRLPGGGLITENTDPASGLRNVTMRQAGHWSTFTLHLVTPAWLADAVKRHGMRLTFQHSEPHPVLKQHRIVIIKASKPI